MKRDMDLVREILLAVEADPSSPLMRVKVAIPSRSDDEISYHIQLLVQAGLLLGRDHSNYGGYSWAAHSMTWGGHEFLENIRDPEVWAKTKGGAELVGGFGIDVLTALAKGFIKQKVKEHTGLEVDL